MKKLVFFIFVAFISVNLSFSQENNQKKVGLNLGTDIVSKYVWRGSQFGQSVPALQPYMELSAGSIVAGFFGSTGLSGTNSFQEFDFYVGANFIDDMVSAYIYDYYFPSLSSDYFDYNYLTTGHTFELDLLFNGTEKIPFTALLAVNFFGADALKIDNDPNSVHFNDRIGIKHSTYFEAGYVKTLGKIEFNPFLGFNLTNAVDANPNTGYVGENGYYSDSMGLIHAGIKVSKKIEITDKFSLPVFAQVSTNYQAKQVFYVFGLSF